MWHLFTVQGHSRGVHLLTLTCSFVGVLGATFAGSLATSRAAAAQAAPATSDAASPAAATAPISPAADRHSALLVELEVIRKRCGVPGASFALLEHGEIVIAEGLGIRRAGGDTAVDRDTLF